ncbi:hypothetical protein MCA2554 [Methylococcus capsulatus str. Bath]|uniref:Uncharacterized protein n=1 Tax=Methylococcus capsulatus (strain ATCC 33009 / NCIMB 11132 / Bath) TaxID=243233 RepID=Q604I5_METCA|nr:hypothetical protein MCA2554 [Methylococcus capsulatus str. Bath]
MNEKQPSLARSADHRKTFGTKPGLPEGLRRISLRGTRATEFRPTGSEDRPMDSIELESPDTGG